MSSMLNEVLLREIAQRGEIGGAELVQKVDRKIGDHTDFYSLAAMVHSGYIGANTADNSRFGDDVQETAVMLRQLSTPRGQSFQFEDLTREGWSDFPITFFITGDGVLKLEQLDEKNAAKLQKRKDYAVSAGVAILAAVLSSTATHVYSLSRDAKQKIPICQQQSIKSTIQQK